MKKAVIVTSFASKELIMKYKDLPLIGVEKGIELIANLKLPISLAIGDFDTLDYKDALKYVKQEQIFKLSPHKDYSDTESAVEVMQKYGFDEIIILGTLQGRYDHTHALLILTCKYPKCKISLEDDMNKIFYLSKGSYAIEKGDFKYIGFFGFPKAVISVENSQYNSKKLKLDFTQTKAISNQLIDRIAEIDVHKGGILVIQSKENIEKND